MSKDSDLRAEQETIVRWDRTSDPVTVCCCYFHEWERMDKAGFEATEVDVDPDDGKVRCKTYEIPRNQVNVQIRKAPANRDNPGFSVVEGKTGPQDPFGNRRKSPNDPAISRLPEKKSETGSLLPLDGSGAQETGN